MLVAQAIAIEQVAVQMDTIVKCWSHSSCSKARLPARNSRRALQLVMVDHSTQRATRGQLVTVMAPLLSWRFMKEVVSEKLDILSRSTAA